MSVLSAQAGLKPAAADVVNVLTNGKRGTGTFLKRRFFSNRQKSNSASDFRHRTELFRGCSHDRLDRRRWRRRRKNAASRKWSQNRQQPRSSRRNKTERPLHRRRLRRRGRFRFRFRRPVPSSESRGDAHRSDPEANRVALSQIDRNDGFERNSKLHHYNVVTTLL